MNLYYNQLLITVYYNLSMLKSERIFALFTFQHSTIEYF